MNKIILPILILSVSLFAQTSLPPVYFAGGQVDVGGAPTNGWAQVASICSPQSGSISILRLEVQPITAPRNDNSGNPIWSSVFTVPYSEPAPGDIRIAGQLRSGLDPASFVSRAFVSPDPTDPVISSSLYLYTASNTNQATYISTVFIHDTTAQDAFAPSSVEGQGYTWSSPSGAKPFTLRSSSPTCLTIYAGANHWPGDVYVNVNVIITTGN